MKFWYLHLHLYLFYQPEKSWGNPPNSDLMCLSVDCFKTRGLLWYLQESEPQLEPNDTPFWITLVFAQNRFWQDEVEDTRSKVTSWIQSWSCRGLPERLPKPTKKTKCQVSDWKAANLEWATWSFSLRYCSSNLFFRTEVPLLPSEQLRIDSCFSFAQQFCSKEVLGQAHSSKEKNKRTNKFIDKTIEQGCFTWFRRAMVLDQRW